MSGPTSELAATQNEACRRQLKTDKLTQVGFLPVAPPLRVRLFLGRMLFIKPPAKGQ